MAFVDEKTKINLPQFLASLVDFIIPPACPVCRELVSGHAGVCASCWRDLDFITPPICYRTGVPLAEDPGPEGAGLAAMIRPPPYHRARAALAYSGVGAQLIRRMKYSDQSELAAMLAPLVMRAATPLFAAADLIVPVPMHRWRLARRRFNQSAELARALSRLSGVPMQVHILERHRATAQQVGLTRAARRSNLRGAFRVRADAKTQIAGRHVLLVDDVLTTGATVEACTRTLLRAGAGEVDVVTLARVVMPETLPV